MATGGIYIIRLSDTHYYGGRTKCFRTRWRNHLRALRGGSHSNRHAQSVFNLYGRFEPQVVVVLVEDHQEAEQAWLDKNVGTPGCVNISPNAIGGNAIVWTEEARKRLSEAHKGHVVSDDTRKKLSEANQGKVLSIPHVEKIRVANTGKRHTAESLGKMSASHKNLSEETRKKLSDSHRGTPLSSEHRARLALAQQARRAREKGGP